MKEKNLRMPNMPRNSQMMSHARSNSVAKPRKLTIVDDDSMEELVSANESDKKPDTSVQVMKLMKHATLHDRKF